MIDVILLAIALSMDAFAVSIGLGTKNNQPPRLALLAAVYFGSFQAIMPLIGYLGGKGILGWIESFTTWVACGLLILIGSKMIFESFAEGVEDEIAIITHKVMLMLALATSIDAMAAGFSLTVLDVNPFIACLIIGLTTFCFGWAGVRIGGLRGAWLESKAELLGGVILILVGIKILLL